ncbi:MAG: GTP cyclohydrolase II [Spiribacter sp.]|jgi:GTP cyclohydrolase II|nr:GTP cyclohydrolase II [Spiribacter sp.]MDR9488931.1 GTP cyclohydrolase II [Spiribacter sp.]
MQRIRRALIDLRRGEPVYVGKDCGGLLMIALENLNDARLAAIRQISNQPPQLLLTAHRAAALGMEGASASGIAVPAPQNTDAEALAGMAHEWLTAPTQRGRATQGAESAALHLLRQAALLPAALAVDIDAPSLALKRAMEHGEILAVTETDIQGFNVGATRAPERISEAQVPLDHAESSRFVVFREADGLLEHVALLIGSEVDWPDTPALRMHSACLTGDLFGSLRCDCGEQLRGAVQTIAKEGGGVLLYLAQEGRGIGLANKLRAYGLQDTGLDTVDADQLLGFGEDERRYEVAAAMLNDLGISRVRLMTNNPGKIAALEAAGIEIAGREALHGALNTHNARYLTAKSERAGHWLDEVLRSQHSETHS